MTLDEARKSIGPVNKNAEEAAWQHWDKIAKPLRSLGKLEKGIVRIAGIQGTPQVDVKKKALIIMCADNGVVEEGVTQTGQEITALVAENFLDNKTCTTIMAASCGTDLFPVDIGMVTDTRVDRSEKIAYGTANIRKGSAMTREQAIRAVEVGIHKAEECVRQGYRILATGEMGIGNTTTSSAVISVLLGVPVEMVTGKGAGLSDKGLDRKIQVIRDAIEFNQPDPKDALDVVAKVGGFDLAGLAGVFLGGAALRVPVVIDGLISAAAALIAQRICPECASYMMASHVSREPAGRLVLEALKMDPWLDCEMCLGEGSGAVAMFPLLDMAALVYSSMETFEGIHMDAYVPL
ncbi:MAG: nicotinate-nucleotide--dimethylbenzimidazole phosphoribosyltransferase [Clostridiales bacterium]|nr:nicotinate-nucleotide--dimethylbenzimidazole phosphoribosyltransferase [Clostridiales bacterium]